MINLRLHPSNEAVPLSIEDAQPMVAIAINIDSGEVDLDARGFGPTAPPLVDFLDQLVQSLRASVILEAPQPSSD